jgi:hypothetical protein
LVCDGRNISDWGSWISHSSILFTSHLTIALYGRINKDGLRENRMYIIPYRTHDIVRALFIIIDIRSNTLPACYMTLFLLHLYFIKVLNVRSLVRYKSQNDRKLLLTIRMDKYLLLMTLKNCGLWIIPK